ncbi:MAG: hypothetical protein JNL12_15570 [Planctomycetes bacterium]|nr:hypothetical protein [Planctomycetota bacterium]
MTDPDDAVRVPDDRGAGDPLARAELAVLEQALHEHFTDRTPPDLWPAVAARSAATHGLHPSSTATRLRSLLGAAVMLFGLAVVTTMLLWRPAADRDVPASVPQDPSATLPSDLAALQAELVTTNEIQVQTRAVWSPELRRWATLPRHDLDALFQSPLHPALDADLVARIRAAIADAKLAPGVGGDAPLPTWSHHLLLPRKRELMVRIGGDAPPLLGFASANGPVLLHAPGFPFAELEPVAMRTTKATVEAQGIVLGAGGFAAVPTTATRMRLFDVPNSAVGELARYPSLRQLDLTAAPAWHDAATLRALAASSLESLTVAPHRLDAAAFGALGQLRTLQELFLVERHPVLHVFERHATTQAPSLDDTALQALGNLVALRELTLAGGRCTDAGLQALAALPIELLALVDCDAVRGETLAALPQVRELIVRGGNLGRAATSQLANLPKLKRLYLLEAAAALPLGPLASSRSLADLTITGPFARSELPQLAPAGALRELRLQPTPPFADGELPLLHELRQLKRLSLAGSTAAQRAALHAALPNCQVGDELW